MSDERCTGWHSMCPHVLQASRSAQGALLVAQQQVQRQLQQPPEGLQQLLHDAKAYMPLLPKPPEPIQHALDALADATLGKLGETAFNNARSLNTMSTVSCKAVLATTNSVPLVQQCSQQWTACSTWCSGR